MLERFCSTASGSELGWNDDAVAAARYSTQMMSKESFQKTMDLSELCLAGFESKGCWQIHFDELIEDLPGTRAEPNCFGIRRLSHFNEEFDFKCECDLS